MNPIVLSIIDQKTYQTLAAFPIRFMRRLSTHLVVLTSVLLVVLNASRALRHLRYGLNGNIVSIEMGRRTATGEGHYFLDSPEGPRLFSTLDG